MLRKYGESYEVDENTICQCTGLKDKNGNLIWEMILSEIYMVIFIKQFGRITIISSLGFASNQMYFLSV